MKICIVGGGTAGWLAALFISKIRPEHTVDVIESSSISIIGAGEGSTGALVDVLSNKIWNFGCNEIDFLKETGASLKYGILHKGWTADTEQSYFAPLGGTNTSGSLVDYAYAYGHSHFSDKSHLTTSLGLLVEHGYSNFNKNTFKFMKTNSVGHALHFDAWKVGQYFKKITLSSNNVAHTDAEVIQVNLDDVGFIKSLTLTSGKEIHADFFIDASGFKRVLMNALGEKWHSYKDHLPVNTALPFILDYNTPDELPAPYTTAWAQDAGWMWQIPQQNRIGCGYVFCDDFITPDQAHAEIETRLQKKVTPIRTLKFETGRLDNVWNKNCLAIGLCAAFAEPLEATSIHSTIAQLYSFVFEFLKSTPHDTTNNGSIKLYNSRVSRLYDDYKDFLVMHYMGGRTDTEFWKFISAGKTVTEKVEMLIETAKSRMPSTSDVPDYFGSAGWGLWSFVMGGVGRLSPEVCYNDLILNRADLNTSLLTQAKQFVDNSNADFNLLKQELMSYKNFVNFIRN
jgi:hypothetical protein